LSSCIVALLLDIRKRKKFLSRILLTYKKFILYHDVKDPSALSIWLKDNEVWFGRMVRDLMKYLRLKGIKISEDKILNYIYIKFRDSGKVGYYDKLGTWVNCFGFQRKGYIEIEWLPCADDDYTRNLIRHEVSHYLIDLVMPRLSEKTHHEIMKF
jgi:hypothetical protein